MNPANFGLIPRLFASILAACLVLGTLAAQQGGQQRGPERFTAETRAVRVPVVVIKETDEGKDQLYTDLTKENFLLYEDGQRREITNFTSGDDAPLTLVLLLEDSETVQYLKREIYRPAGIFVSQIMGNKDYASIIAFDRRPHVLTDFTRDQQKLLDAVNRIARSPAAIGEGALFDAVKFALAGGLVEGVEYKGLAEVKGRTGLILIASGVDVLSKINFGEARRVAANSGVPVYALGVGERSFVRNEPYLSGPQRLDFLQAQQQLRGLAEISGGRFYSVRFEAAVEEVLSSMAKMLRFQYTLAFMPQHAQTRSGDPQEHEIEVKVDVDKDGQPDEDGITVQHRKKYWTGTKVLDVIG